MTTVDRSCRVLRWRLAAVVLALAGGSAPAAEKLLHGLEDTAGLKTSGRVTRATGADAVTQGASALELAAGASVTVTIPANFIDEVGWLKIDTFEVQPVLASLELTLAGMLSQAGHVRPGNDTLALPLGLAARTYRGPWPAKPTALRIRNTGRESVVIDNVRLAGPAQPPAGAVLLDFGPSDQALWPGFEHADSQGTGIAWSGTVKIFGFSLSHPDPLGGDFAGRRPSTRTQETLTVESPSAPGVACAWLTRYGSVYSAVLEYAVRVNNRTLLQRRLSPAEMLSPAGLLRGRDEPWTSEWFQQSFVPEVLTRLEFPLKPGSNSVELGNCQIAALVVAPRARQQAMRNYVERVEQDLKRYRRQFVLARQHHPQCDVPPAEEEDRAGVMIFLPPADEWFGRAYAPTAEHRAGTLKLAAAAGMIATAALVAVPCKDAASLQVSFESLRGVGVGAIPGGALRVCALERLPLVEGGCVYWQPYLPARRFRSAKARGVYWFLAQVAVPQRARAGTYQGTLRVTRGKTSAKLPVELRVYQIAAAAGDGGGQTFGVLADGDVYAAYRSLALALPAERRGQLTRDILSQLFAAGLNAGVVPGPLLSSIPTPAPDRMIRALQVYPRPTRPGKALVDLQDAIRVLQAAQIQPGTALHTSAVGNLVQASNEWADKGRLGNYALFVASAGLSEATKLASLARKAGGRPAVSTGATSLAAAPAAERAELFKALDTLICTPNHKGLGGLGDEFRRSGPEKTLAVSVGYGDVYTCGFYSWGIGADGVYVQQIFSAMPLFNAFWFDGQSLLVPTSQGGFEPTLGLLQLGCAMQDYALAKRCEALLKLAKARPGQSQQLEKVLTEIRLSADAAVPGFDRRRWQPVGVSSKQVQDWRLGLLQAAEEVSKQLRP